MTNFVPPASIESEKSLLGACLIEGCSPPCSAEDFHSTAHQLIAKAMQSLEASGVTVDFVTTYERIGQSGSVDQCGGPQYLVQLSESVGSASNLDRYAETVRTYGALRKLQLGALKFVQTTSRLNGADPVKLMSQYSSEVLRDADISTGGDQEISSKESVKRALARIERKMDGETGLIGIPTGVPELDMLTGGMEPGKLIVIAARPSMGKTALAVNIATDAARLGNAKVLIFSLEMPESSLMNRILSRSSRIESNKIRDGRLSPKEYAAILSAAPSIADLPITIWDSPCSEIEIIRKAKRIKPDLLVVDYLQLVKLSSATGRKNDDVGAASKAMKHLAGELKIPVILLSQLNRDIEKDKRRPRLSDLRDSGEIEQDADWIIFIHQANGDHQQQDREIILAKQRDGDCGVWKMDFLRQYQAFERAYMPTREAA